MGLLKNKIAIITGGGRGIGKAIANQYSEQGATVIIAEFDENSGRDTAETIGAYFFKTDIGDEKEVASLFEYVKTKFSRLDVLVNNAGNHSLATDKGANKHQQHVYCEYCPILPGRMRFGVFFCISMF